MGATKALARYLKDKGISIAYISKRTGLSIGILYPALGSGKGRGRKLNADEFLTICSCLDVDPMQFKVDASNNSDEVIENVN